MAGMVQHRRNTWLLVLIMIELAGAAVVLRWLFAPAPIVAPLQSTATPAPPATISLPSGLPPDVRASVERWARIHSYVSAHESDEPDLRVAWRKSPGARPVGEWVLVAAAAFPTSRRDVTEGALRDAWLGRGGMDAGEELLVVTPQVGVILEALWGEHGSDPAVAIVAPEEIVDRVWARSEEGSYDHIAIVPFHQLDPRLSPLAVDGVQALDPDLDLARYPLVARLWAKGQRAEVESLAASLVEVGASTNRHRERLTDLVVTGVTALTRGVAVQIEAHGDPAWPARGVADLLASADVTHVSNEVSFVPGCEAQVETTAFCARPEYLETLRAAGVDVVELTGNHNLDLGPAPARASLALYREAGMHVFGGGEDEAAARRPLVVEHNGNRVSFLGYNTFGPHYAWASVSGPGAARFAIDAVAHDVAQAKAHAGLVLVTMQYTETYDVLPLPRQVADFHAVADAGADVVVGTQAHQPQAIEFYDGTPIFYGLGNLFFDQTWSAPTCQSLVVRLIIYDGRLLVVRLVPTTMDADCQPYVAPPAERDAILREVFEASGW
ncbi:MAG: CapA family protein [Anaerolineae bacterium]|nr:CapA family protein [Anaerolineae bacterium]